MQNTDMVLDRGGIPVHHYPIMVTLINSGEKTKNKVISCYYLLTWFYYKITIYLWIYYVNSKFTVKLFNLMVKIVYIYPIMLVALNYIYMLFKKLIFAVSILMFVGV